VDGERRPAATCVVGLDAEKGKSAPERIPPGQRSGAAEGGASRGNKNDYHMLVGDRWKKGEGGKDEDG